jgi:signal transduction histidine kinase
MRAYRHSISLKRGLVAFAVLIAVASLFYTQRVVGLLAEREAYLVDLWAEGIRQLARSQSSSGFESASDLADLALWLDESGALPEAERARYAAAVRAAQQSTDPSIDFIVDRIVRPKVFGIPAILIDASGTPVLWDNVAADSAFSGDARADSLLVARLLAYAADMSDLHEPLPIRVEQRGQVVLDQQLYYGNSRVVRELRIFPFVQLGFVGLFVLIGYAGFSYVRRSEQSSLWVGMAKEAAHQLGTPLSGLMGWTELLRTTPLSDEQREAVDEIEADTLRLRRVTSRFSDIGSLPKLAPQPLDAAVAETADYIRRRLPSLGRAVTLDVDVPPGLNVRLNAELFSWVVENLLKNAVDAMEREDGRIAITAFRQAGHAVVDVSDTGKGIARADQANVFRPGYSSKKRGWGLGLSLARRIVEDYHGGRIRLHHSAVGEGTTFRIELPLAEPDAD